MLDGKLQADLEKPEAEPRGPELSEHKCAYPRQPAPEAALDDHTYTYDRILNPTHIVSE